MRSISGSFRSGQGILLSAHRSRSSTTAIEATRPPKSWPTPGGVHQHTPTCTSSWEVFTEKDRATTLACSLDVVGILLHSLVDFNLGIPANTAFSLFLCSIAELQLGSPRVYRSNSIANKVREIVLDKERCWRLSCDLARTSMVWH